MTFVATEGTISEMFGFEIDEAIQLGPKPAMDELAISQAQDEEMEELGGMDVRGGEEDPNPGCDLEQQTVRYEIGVALPEEIRVNEIPLTVDSPLRSLRAACAFYQIGQSGGKRKCFSRLVAHQGVDDGKRSSSERASYEPEDSFRASVGKEGA